MTLWQPNETVAVQSQSADAVVSSPLAVRKSTSTTEFTCSGLRLWNEVCPPPPDRMAYPSVADHCLTLHVTNLDTVERRLDGGKWQCRQTFPGTFAFIPAHQVPEWLWQAEIELLEIYIPPSLLEKTALESFDTAPSQIELIDRFGIGDSFLEQIALGFKAELASRIPLNHLYLESLQTVLAVHLLRHHCSISVVDTVLAAGLPKKRLQQVVDYIQDNLDQDLSLAELANVVQLSSHHFGKLFKQTMGVSPYQYVMKCRIEQAKHLLADNERSIVNVSQLLGFHDQSHFTNVFRRYTTLTPRQYRQRL